MPPLRPTNLRLDSVTYPIPSVVYYGHPTTGVGAMLSRSTSLRPCTVRTADRLFSTTTPGSGGVADFVIARFTEALALDTSFDGDGILTTDFGDYDVARGVVIAPDGKIVAAGYSGDGFALARYIMPSGLEERYFAQHDANFNITSITDANGQVAERYLYTAYGEVTAADGAWYSLSGTQFGMRYFFQGGRYQADAATYNFRNRDYSPALGRWMSQDPMGYVDGMNMYVAYRNSPICSLDPNGLQPKYYKPPVGRNPTHGRSEWSDTPFERVNWSGWVLKSQGKPEWRELKTYRLSLGSARAWIMYQSKYDCPNWTVAGAWWRAYARVSIKVRGYDVVFGEMVAKTSKFAAVMSEVDNYQWFLSVVLPESIPFTIADHLLRVTAKAGVGAGWSDDDYSWTGKEVKGFFVDADQVREAEVKPEVELEWSPTAAPPKMLAEYEHLTYEQAKRLLEEKRAETDNLINLRLGQAMRDRFEKR